MAICAIARITMVPDRLEIAEAIARSVLAEQPVTPTLAMYAKAALAMLAVENGDQSAAAEHHAYLLGQRGTMLWTIISVDRLLGLLSSTMGDMGQATQHFEDGIAFCRKAGYKPERAWICCDYADTLKMRAAEGERLTMIALLDESLAIATDLGMRPLVEKAAGLKDSLAGQTTARTAYPDGLTRREVEVIRLVASGKTDREIAEELIISINTVGNHVRSILNKTNSANRTEAATYANQHGLIPPS